MGQLAYQETRMSEQSEVNQMSEPKGHCIRLEFDDGSGFEFALPASVWDNGTAWIKITRPVFPLGGGETTQADRFYRGSRYAGGRIAFGAYGEAAIEGGS
jgi:hypothetical protein